MHYYSYKLHEVEELDINTFNKLVKCMNINKARERLEDMENLVYPNAKKTAADKIRRKVYNIAIPVELRQDKAVTTDQLSKIYGDYGSIDAALKKKK